MKYLFLNTTEANLEQIKRKGLEFSQLSEDTSVNPCSKVVGSVLLIIPISYPQSRLHLSIGRKYSLVAQEIVIKMLNKIYKLYPDDAAWGGKFEQLSKFINKDCVIPKMLDYHRLTNFAKSLAQDKMEKNANVGIFKLTRILKPRQISALYCRVQVPPKIIDL